MIHKIIPGLSTIYTKEADHADVLPSSRAAGIMDFLVSTPAVLTMIIEAAIFLDFTGHDATGVICKGTYERSIVNKDHLIEIAYRRAKINAKK